MSEEDLERIVIKDSSGLRPEVFEIIKKELSKRNMNPALMDSAFIQNTFLSEEVIQEYASIIRSLPCPNCKKINLKLNAASAWSIRGFLFLTMKKEEFKIACPGCLDKFVGNVNFSNLLLGWWSLSGFIQTPIYIYRNFSNRKENASINPTADLKIFIRNYVGEIELSKNDSFQLQQIITKRTSKEKYRY